MASELLTEAVKMRRVPGIYFMTEASGRVPKIVGTGLDVWEIVRDFRNSNADWESLGKSWHWLTGSQLEAALAYADAYPEELDEALREAEC